MPTLNLGRVRPVYSGAWAGATTYSFLTVVENNGASYIAVQAVPADTPPPNATYWELISSKGDTGPAGSDGAQGPMGPQGPTGPASAWGTIPGTLSDQTDLQTALNGKAPLAHTHAGSIITQVGHGLSLLDCVTSTAGVWAKAIANDVTTTAAGIVVDVIDADTFEIAQGGRVNAVAHGLTVDEYYFLSDTTAGALSATEPGISQPIIYVESADYVWVLPYRPSLQYDTAQHELVWKDLKSSLSLSRDTGPTAPDWLQVGSSGIYHYHFDAAINETLQTDFHFDHDYALGTDTFPHIHWLPTTAAAGTVRWLLEIWYSKGHGQEAFGLAGAADATVVIEQAAQGSAYDHMIAEGIASAITSRIEPDGGIMMKITRDAAHANDTYPDDAIAFQADIHYQADRVGTINKAPNFYA